MMLRIFPVVWVFPAFIHTPAKMLLALLAFYEEKKFLFLTSFATYFTLLAGWSVISIIFVTRLHSDCGHRDSNSKCKYEDLLNFTNKKQKVILSRYLCAFGDVEYIYGATT
eukprot:m.122207 g.122207  ORF g.122207 m.122207 type:complete len:111 (+) comp14420_c6_seq1:365-697(+)